MKSIFFSFFFILTNLLFAQQYTPLLNQHNEWHFTSCYFGCLTDIYFTDGDTIVNGENHKILDGYHYISRTFLLKENTTEKKVYLTKIEPNRIDEFLLYDFSLNEGDSILMFNPTSPFPEWGGYFYLDSIRLHPLQDGDNYKHFYFRPSPFNSSLNSFPVWIEGVGSLSLINAPGGMPDINDVGELSCFFKYGELFYQNLDSIGLCETELLEVETQDHNESFKVKTIIPFEFYEIESNKPIRRYKIYNLSGVLFSDVDNIIFTDTISINLRTYDSGVYMVYLIDIDNKIHRIKLVKNHF